MASFLKKALSVFVEFDEEEGKETKSSLTNSPILPPEISRNQLSHEEAGKFEKYFDRLFDQANLPGPDYFEFYKMMETLEAHIHDEKARLSATFASLSIQGLTKNTLVETAKAYKVIIEKDKTDFDHALKDKLKLEVGQRQEELQRLDKRILQNSEQIQKLTKEISEFQQLNSKLKTEIVENENKLMNNSRGYDVASQAIINKIVTDIEKIQSTL